MTVLQVIRKSKVPTTVKDTIIYQAALFVEILRDQQWPHVEQLDFSAQSLATIDMLLDTYRLEKEAFDDSCLQLVSAYVLEVARRLHGGMYVRSHPRIPPMSAGSYILAIGEGRRLFYYAVGRRALLRAHYEQAKSLLTHHQDLEDALREGVGGILL